MARRLLVLLSGVVALTLLVLTDAHWANYLGLGLMAAVAWLTAQPADLATGQSIPGGASPSPGQRRAGQREAYLGEARVAGDVDESLGEAGVGLLVCDPMGTVLSATGRTGDIVPGVDPSRVKSPPVVRLIAHVAQRGSATEATLQAGTRDRSLRCVGVPLRAGRVGVVITDVTESERVQAMRTSFVSDASHELKTPIAAIRAGSEALQAALGVDEMRAGGFAEQIEAQAVRLGHIVEDLLDLSRLEAGPVEMSEFDLTEVVGAEVAAVRSLADRSGVIIGLNAESVSLVGSALDVGIAVRNLLSNAVRYTPRGGNVDVTIGIDDGEAVVAVVDSGMGISAADQARVFERFFRVDNARSRAVGGTGLGLSIVRHVMAHHRGTAEVESISGKGSTFRLRFPLAE